MKRLLQLFIVFLVGSQLPTYAQVVSITTLGSTYSQDFDSLASSGTANTSLPYGWYFSETSGNTTYAADYGSLNSGNTYSYGATGSSDRALGGLQSGSNTPTIGAAFTNNTGSAISAIEIQFVVEHWRLGATGRIDTSRFEMS
nr:hypothetical protein [Bacteroidota bacterium]